MAIEKVTPNFHASCRFKNRALDRVSSVFIDLRVCKECVVFIECNSNVVFRTLNVVAWQNLLHEHGHYNVLVALRACCKKQTERKKEKSVCEHVASTTGTTPQLSVCRTGSYCRHKAQLTVYVCGYVLLQVHVAHDVSAHQHKVTLDHVHGVNLEWTQVMDAVRTAVCMPTSKTVVLI